MYLSELYHGGIPGFLREASAAPQMQRLRDVGMNCGCEYTSFPLFAGLQPYSRFDHSLGVGLITWHFTQDSEQAMAALLHDINTPVFSHVVDFLNGDHLTQESTESGTEKRILESEELLSVFHKYGIRPDKVTDYHRYPIADNPSPMLSADRLEYTLSNAVNYGFLTVSQVQEIYHDLQVGEGELVFRSRQAACLFAYTALRCGKVYVSNEDRYAMEVLSRLLRDAIDAGILTREDLDTREKPVITKLQASSLEPRWRAFRHLRQMLTSPTPKEGWLQVGAKKRYIDPYIKDVGRASSADPRFAKALSDFLADPMDTWLCGIGES